MPGLTIKALSYLKSCNKIVAFNLNIPNSEYSKLVDYTMTISATNNRRINLRRK